MKCFHPRDIRVPGDDCNHTGYKYIQVPCGKCIACMRRRQNDWAIRILTEAKYHRSVYFVTLTQDDEHIRFSKIGFPTLDLKDMQDFMKRLRRWCDYRRLPSPRVFYCGEYGDLGLRPHYHAVLFFDFDVNRLDLIDILEKNWKRGFCSVSELTPARAKYVAKYCCKALYDTSSLVGTDCLFPFRRNV